MSYVNPRLLTLKPYKVASHKIWSVPAGERSQILKLDWNEATVPPSPKVREALKALMEEEDFFHLYPSTFNEELMQALSAYTGMPAANIQYFGSSDSLHEYISRAYLGEGRKVLVLWPSYDNFRLTAESTGAKLCYSEMSADFELSLQQLREDLAREKPAMAYICNPNNPTGTLIPSACVEELVSDFRETIFLLDEHVGSRLTNESTAQWILERGYNEVPTVCDSAEPKSVADYRSLGVNARKAVKGPGSVEYGMKWLQGRKIVIDARRTPEAFREFSRYEFERDREGNFVSGYPDRDNHLIDAVRYALERVMRQYRSNA